MVQSGLSGNRVVHQICLGCKSTLGYASNWGLRSITDGRLYSKGVGEVLYVEEVLGAWVKWKFSE